MYICENRGIITGSILNTNSIYTYNKNINSIFYPILHHFFSFFQNAISENIPNTDKSVFYLMQLLSTNHVFFIKY